MYEIDYLLDKYNSKDMLNPILKNLIGRKLNVFYEQYFNVDNQFRIFSKVDDFFNDLNPNISINNDKSTKKVVYDKIIECHEKYLKIDQKFNEIKQSIS